jgi:putative membrane protein
MAALAYAHTGGQADVSAMALHWNTEPDLLAVVSLVLVIYAFGIGPLRQYLAPHKRFPRRRAGAFGLGMAILYGALASPLDAIGEQLLFSVHMLQHVMLIYPVPMLLFLGTPGWLLAPLLKPAAIAAAVRGATRPVTAAVLFLVVFSAWHIPGLYEWALRDRLVHNLEHLTILGTAVLMWWPILSPVSQVPRLTPGLQMLYLLALSIGQIPIFAYLTFTSEVLYPTYETAARLVPITPLEDQQLGGIIMKLAGMVVLFGVLAAVFWRWYQTENTHRASLGWR